MNATTKACLIHEFAEETGLIMFRDVKEFDEAMYQASFVMQEAIWDAGKIWARENTHRAAMVAEKHLYDEEKDDDWTIPFNSACRDIARDIIEWEARLASGS